MFMGPDLPTAGAGLPTQGADVAGPRVPARVQPRPARLQVLSDLHCDPSPLPLPRLADDVDAVVVAGDTCEGAEKAFAHLRAAFPPPTPVLVVLGNRAYHGRVLLEELENARRLAVAYGIKLLEDRTEFVGRVRFIGSTMWTGYDLDGNTRQPQAMAYAAAGMADHRRIALAARPSVIPFTPLHALSLFQASTARMMSALGHAWDGPTVIVTHHAPSIRSLNPRFVYNPLAPAFASNLDAMVRGSGAALWVHGHVHRSCDYALGGTRVLCNPRGWPGENPDFNEVLVVEVPCR